MKKYPRNHIARIALPAVRARMEYQNAGGIHKTPFQPKERTRA